LVTRRHNRRAWKGTSRGAIAIGAGFAAGAIPFANIAARWSRGVDLRTVGTGTVSGSGLFEVAGFGPLAVAGVLDVAKGAVGPALAPPGHPGIAAVAGAAAVAGHNWSPFLRGAGGRGISPAIGALLVQAWPGAAVLLGGLAVGRLAGQTALGSLAADALLVPILYRWGGRHAAAAGAAVLAPMLVKRLRGNAPIAGDRPATLLNRLLFDRDRNPDRDRRNAPPGAAAP
jgi:glycerol-3-phosphate acyltransferase PlsY